MSASLLSELSSAPARHSPVTFSGKGREFLSLLIKGSLLQIPTFGFYRFWLITKLRRHLWANTQLGGEAFEYTGTGKELLIGFLIALAILTPLYLGYFVLGIILEEAKALASLPLVLLMYVLMHFAAYRARRYRATRTVFRGIRFWMKGSGWAYAFRAILWDFANLLTLGLALPWATASLERYRMRHTYFGTIQGEFVGSGWTLFKRGFWVWALGIVLLFGPFLVSGALFGGFEEAGDTNSGDFLLLQFIPFLAFLIILALAPLAMAIFTRWQMEGIRFGEVAVSSNLRKRDFYGTFFKLIASLIGLGVAFGLVAIAVIVVTSEYFPGAAQAMDVEKLTSDSLPVVVIILLDYLILLLGIGIVQRYFMGRGLWAVIVNSLAVSNLHAIDKAVAAGLPSGVLGEGLADALDFEVGI